MTTIIEPGTAAPPPAAPHKTPWWKRPVTWLITAVAVLALVAAGAIGASVDHSTAAKPRPSSSAPANPSPKVTTPAPAVTASATAILSQDGYSLVQEMPASDVADSNGMVLSGAIGAKGDSTEYVLVTTNAGTAQMITSLIKPSDQSTGVNVAADGNVIRVTGTTSQVMTWADNLSKQFGSSSPTG